MKVLLLKLICKENEIQYCESKIFIIYSQSRSRWVPWKIKEWSRLFPLKKWYCVKWIVIHGKMRALEERGGELVLLMRSRLKNFSNFSIALPKNILQNTWLNIGFLKSLFPRAFYVLVFIMKLCKQALRCSIT